MVRLPWLVPKRMYPLGSLGRCFTWVDRSIMIFCFLFLDLPGILLPSDDQPRVCPMGTDESDDQGSRRSDHAQQRAGQGRPVGSALRDVLKAGGNDVVVQ